MTLCIQARRKEQCCRIRAMGKDSLLGKGAGLGGADSFGAGSSHSGVGWGMNERTLLP